MSTYIRYPAEGGSYITSVTNPLVVTAADLSILDAGAAQAGIVSTGTQTFAGDKTFSSPIRAPSGSVSAPGFTFSAETNTGIYLDGALDMALAVNGVQALNLMYIAASQINWGIGTAAVSGAGNYFVADRVYNGDVYYQWANTSSGSSSATIFDVLNGPASNHMSLENRAYTVSGYLAGGCALAANSNMTQLNIMAEYASAYIAFNVGGRTLATERMRLNSTDLTLNKIPLKMNGATSGTMTMAAAAAITDYTITWPAAQGGASTVLTNDGSGNLSWGSAGGSGTVTSVALSVPGTSIFGVTGSPVTTTGTLGLTTTGTSGGIPYFSSTSVLSSSGELTASQLVLGGGAGAAPTSLAAGTQYQVLTMGATTPGYGAVNLAQSAAVTGALGLTNGGTGQTTATAAFDALSPMTTLGDTIYGGASGTRTRLAGNATTTKKYLAQTGDGANSAAPTWSQPAFSELSGSVAASQMPALTGDVTTSAGSVATTIANSAVTNAKMANMNNNTIKGNVSGSAAAPSDLTAANVASIFTLPTIQKFTSGSGTYTTPANCRWIRVTMVGGGGGGGGGGSASVGDGTAGSASTFGTSLLSANGGALGQGGGGNGGAGGSASLGTGPIGTALSGGYGQGSIQCVSSGINAHGGQGGATAFGGAGGGAQSGNGTAGTANTGSGGGGGGSGTNTNAISGAGGGSGGFVRAIITGPSATYSYAVGSGGSSGAAGAGGGGGTAGGAGSAGYIEVEEYYI